MPGFVARRPDNHHHPIRKKSDCLETRLAVVLARVLYRNGRSGKDDRRIGKIQASLAEGCLTLYRIECDLKCTPI